MGGGLIEDSPTRVLAPLFFLKKKLFDTRETNTWGPYVGEASWSILGAPLWGGTGASLLQRQLPSWSLKPPPTQQPPKCKKIWPLATWNLNPPTRGTYTCGTEYRIVLNNLNHLWTIPHQQIMWRDILGHDSWDKEVLRIETGTVARAYGDLDDEGTEWNLFEKYSLQMSQKHRNQFFKHTWLKPKKLDISS